MSLVLCLGSACAGSSAPQQPGAVSQAITHGVDDDGDPAVVALLRSGRIFCSGTLVAPRVVLTAAHCLTRVQPEAVLFGSGLANEGALVDVLELRVHPEYEPTSVGNDVGLVLLASTAPPDVRPLPLALDTVAAGSPVRVVGFGTTSKTDREPRRKREGRAAIAAVTPSEFTILASPSQTCAGDSGGPAFVVVDGVERLAGVHSAGDPDCTDSGREARVDPHVASFIAPFLEATREASAGLGTRCWYAENCESGRCLTPADAPRVGYCTRACAASHDCPSGMRCEGGQCLLPLPSPGAAGAACDDHFDCTDALCASPRGGGPSVCSPLCFPDDPGVCPTAFSCLPAASTSPAHACFADAAGGCSVGSSVDRSMLVLFALLRRRRSRPSPSCGPPRG